MPNNTTNFTFNKPLVNNATDADLWGGYLNDNWDSIDALIPHTTSAKTTSFNVGATEFNYVYLVDTSGGDVTATLPAAASVYAGFTVVFKVTEATNDLIIDGNGAETIDGAATKTYSTLYDYVRVVSNGTNWFIENKITADPEKETRFAATYQASGDGASIANSSWAKVPLSNEDFNNITSATLTSSVISLPAGTYETSASVSVYAVAGRCQIRLRDTTNNVTLGLGTTTQTGSGENDSKLMSINTAYTLSGTANVELQVYSNFSGANYGLDVNSGENNAYANILITKTVV